MYVPKSSSVGVWLCAATLLILMGCSSASRGHGDSDSAFGDSISDSMTEMAGPSVEALPDTTYPSAEKVKYVVETMDSSLDPSLSSLMNLYERSKSVLTFRNGPMRQGDFRGAVDSVPVSLEKVWTVDTELEKKDTVFGPWGGGTGWTGQPLYVEWPDSVTARMKKNGVVTAAFHGHEVIFGSLCGKLYFIDPDDGKATRLPIDVGNPIKGTPSVDPTFNGNIYVGQGVPASRPFGAVAFNLISNRRIDFMAEDAKAWRRWGAYDSSPVRVGDYLFRPGENGSIYKYFISNANGGAMKLQCVMRYKVNGVAPGIESSMAVYANYGFVADNHGNVLAINLATLKPVWHYSLDDDSDATPMVAVEDDGQAYVYVGCEIDRVERQFAKFAKLKAATGEKVWEITPEGQRHNAGKKHFDGGFYSSPLLGTGDCSDLIFVNRVKNTNGQNGVFMAIDRADGKVRYEVPTKCYSWSSPVGMLTKAGEMLVLTGDGAGYLYLIEGKSGKVLLTERVGNNFESSPIIVGDRVFIGSRGNGLHCLRLI